MILWKQKFADIIRNDTKKFKIGGCTATSKLHHMKILIKKDINTRTSFGLIHLNKTKTVMHNWQWQCLLLGPIYLKNQLSCMMLGIIIHIRLNLLPKIDLAYDMFIPELIILFHWPIVFHYQLCTFYCITNCHFLNPKCYNSYHNCL